ncbi:hypothetical protein [Streptomyces sp. N35]|uniref:hypothetical protein n=1 Tax=Streptomyces sp. N35 TaxID=2795730 RepID=UPI0018F642C8|nr:hypothetical protein [Streptomyces sp. N35]
MTDQQAPPIGSAVTEVEAAGPDTFIAPPPPKASLKDRRVLRAIARWTLAVVVCGGLGTGAALGITSQERTDVPGLATQGDGRWEYPHLKLPALPANAPRPFSDANPGNIHHAALKDLLLPAPAGAKSDSGAKPVKPAEFTALYAKGDQAAVRDGLRDLAVREIVGRSWTAADGTESRIHLLRFSSVGYADQFLDGISYMDGGVNAANDSGLDLVDIAEAGLDEKWENAGALYETRQYVYAQTGGDRGRMAYLASGDTVALITHTKKGGAERIPFHQTVVLQTQLLS